MSFLQLLLADGFVVKDNAVTLAGPSLRGSVPYLVLPETHTLTILSVELARHVLHPPITKMILV